MEVIKTGVNIATVKISELPQTTDTAGRSTLATNADNESEALGLTQIAEAIDAAANAQQAATDAEEAAKNANTLAGVARTAASNAESAAEDAQTARDDATTAANTATAAVTTAQQAAEDATTAATTAQQAATDAEEAAKDAEEIAADINQDLTGKADLDADKKYLLQTQLDPRTGYQTGAIMGTNIFQSNAAPLMFDGDRTFRLVIKTGENVATAQTIFQDKVSGLCMRAYLSGSTLSLYPKGVGVTFSGIQTNSLYELILVNKGTEAYAYCNQVKKDAEIAEDYALPNTLIIGGVAGAAQSFLGTVIAAQLFDYAFSDADAAASWNNGRPELWRVPDDYLETDAVVFPVGTYTQSANTYASNNISQTTRQNNVPQANGFSGDFMQFDSVDDFGLTVTFWYRVNYLKRRYALRVTVEYRSTVDLYGNYRTFEDLRLPANTGDAQQAVIEMTPNGYLGGLYSQTPGTLQIRVLSIEPIGVVCDLNPYGLLPTVWRDTSGHGNDVPYVPSGDNTECKLSYGNHGFPDVITGTAAPTVIPDFVGQRFIDTTNKNTYTAYGTTAASDWGLN